jgi:hypothetical protein
MKGPFWIFHTRMLRTPEEIADLNIIWMTNEDHWSLHNGHMAKQEQILRKQEGAVYSSYLHAERRVIAAAQTIKALQDNMTIYDSPGTYDVKEWTSTLLPQDLMMDQIIDSVHVSLLRVTQPRASMPQKHGYYLEQA